MTIKSIDRREEIKRDIIWIKDEVIPCMSWGYFLSPTITRFTRSKEMTNILLTYGKERLYKEDLENIVQIAELLL